MIQWLSDNWLKIAIPALAFFATYVVGVWLRRVLDSTLERWRARTKWEGSRLIMIVAHRPVLLWFILLGIVIAIQVSVLPSEVKGMVSIMAGSLFVLSLGWIAIVLCERLLKLYLPRIKAPPTTISLLITVIRVVIIVVVALIVLEIWGAPTTPLLITIGAAILAAALALRNAAPDVFAGFQISANQHVKIGDYIKLETGEEGYVIEISWNHTRLRALDESIVVVPNSRLLQRAVINYGHPLKQASEPFRFQHRAHLTELTGLKARNLRELVDILKKAPEAVVYYHTHRFLEQHHYLTPEPSNDFGAWVADSLGDEAFGERLASVDTFAFPNLAALKERLVGMIEEYLAAGTTLREALPGEEFYYMKSVSVILPSPYAARDLREFVETLRKLSLGSLYFHVFESRLRLGRGLNDFSIWMQKSLGEAELGDEIARLDPYTYTLEGLRLALIQLIEKRIK